MKFSNIYLRRINLEELIEEYRNGFLKLRRSVAKKLSNTYFLDLKDTFNEIYIDLASRAVTGDIVAQDYLGYLFKNGYKDCVEENFDLSMKWQILAGANGNYFTLQKLSLFLNYAYDTIVFQDDFTSIRDKHELTKENYEMVLGRLVCEAMVDEMKLNVLELTKEKLIKVEQTDLIYRQFDRIKFRAVDKVLEYLRK